MEQRIYDSLILVCPETLESLDNIIGTNYKHQLETIVNEYQEHQIPCFILPSFYRARPTFLKKQNNINFIEYDNPHEVHIQSEILLAKLKEKDIKNVELCGYSKDLSVRILKESLEKNNILVFVNPMITH